MANVFKVGDVVKCVSSDWCSVEHGKEYTVSKLDQGEHVYFKGLSCSYPEKDFVRVIMRDKIEEAVKLLVSESICLYKDSWNGIPFICKYNTSYVAKEKSIASFLDHAYPTETPEQKELRELEEQQRKIADRMKELRDKI